MICIADSRWQESLKQSALDAGKLGPDWEIPDVYRRNTPKSVQSSLLEFRQNGLIQEYPFGSDFTFEEEQIARALSYLQAQSQTRWSKIGLMFRALGQGGNFESSWQAILDRMELTTPASLNQKLEKRLLCLAIKSTSPEIK